MVLNGNSNLTNPWDPKLDLILQAEPALTKGENVVPTGAGPRGVSRPQVHGSVRGAARHPRARPRHAERRRPWTGVRTAPPA